MQIDKLPDTTFRERMRAWRLVVGIAYRASRWRAVSAVSAAAAQRLSVPVTAVALGALTDGVVDGDVDRARRALLILAGWVLLTDFINAFAFQLRMSLRERATHQVDLELIRLSTSVEGIEHFERPEFADRVAVLRSTRGLLAGAFDALTWNVGVGIGIIATVGVLARLDGWLLALPLLGLPGVWLSGRAAARNEAVQDELAETIRLRAKLRTLALDHRAGHEVRVFGLHQVLRDEVARLVHLVERRRVAVAVRNQTEGLAGQLLFVLGFIAAIAVLVRAAARGDASVGDVLVGLSLAASVRQQLMGLSQLANWAKQSAESARRFAWLTAYARDVQIRARARAKLVAGASVEPPARLDRGLRLEGVTFRYPGTDTDVLRAVDLTLPAGAIVAIVGDNGAGKSTLVKLLARHYEPTAGRIWVDDVDLAGIDAVAWSKRLSAGFQDYARFQLSALESVGVGDLPRRHDSTTVTAALDRAAAADVVDGLDDGLDTQLGRDFADGHELSGGQWQKLALGRAMMRDDPLLLLLDEPTAALDAESEHALFDRYSQAARLSAARTGAITVLVSHRFSTVRAADLIVVVGDGGIVEVGTHAELMASPGTYAELFDLQAASYR